MREARLPRPVLSPSLREICTTSAGRAWLVLKRIRSREVAAVERLAKTYGLCWSVAWRIVHRKSWSHVQ